MTSFNGREPFGKGSSKNRRRPKAARTRVQRGAPSGAPVVALKNIDVGETDANAEYFLSQRAKSDPMYLKAFFDPDGVTVSSLQNANKFILFGQKGTGKTAILRHLDSKLSSDYITGFVVFRKEIIEEAQLVGLDANISASMVVDEDKIKESKFYYHAMTRLLLTLLLSKCEEIDNIPEDIGWFKSLYSEIKGSSVGQIASLVTDSVLGSLETVTFDVSRATSGVVKVDAAKAIKRSNDAFKKFAFSKIESTNLRARLFLDEMHFAYRDADGLSADAALVRDTILAVREINEKLIELQVDSLIYISVRSEFLEHQEIAVADVSHTIESYGVELSWESAPYDRTHPVFELVLNRIKLSVGDQFTKDDIFSRFIQDNSAPRFLEYTWGKPRDIIRYFKSLIASYPNLGSIRSSNEFGNILRRYSQAAWKDQKAALASFVPKNSLPKVEEAIQEIANRDLDRSKVFKKPDIALAMSDAFQDMVKNGVSYDIDEFIKLLYIVVIFYVSYKDANGQNIVHQFHRGNRKPYSKGEFHVHRAVARALS